MNDKYKENIKKLKRMMARNKFASEFKRAVKEASKARCACKESSPGMASNSGKVLRDPNTPPGKKSFAASVLSQSPRN